MNSASNANFPNGFVRGCERLLRALRGCSHLLVMVLVICASACSSHKPVGTAHTPAVSKATTEPAKKKGRYSLLEDQGPDVDLDVTNIPNAVPKREERTIAGNLSPYTVLGKTYSVQFNAAKYSEIGLASWYGKKFHGERTSNGEIYNMFGMTAAHKTLPIPCYVKVTNLANNKQVILRVNDRGPFHEDRVIDLTYTAAKKLDYHRAGTAKVRVDIINLNDFTPLRSTVKTSPNSRLTGALASAGAIDKAPETVKPQNSSKDLVKPQAIDKPIDADKTPPATTPKTLPQPVPSAKLPAATTPIVAGKPTVASGQSPAKTTITNPTPNTFTPVYLQVGAFASQAGAADLQKKLHSYTKLPIVLMPVEGKKIFRVLIGPITDNNEMLALKQTLTEKKLSTPYVVQMENK